MKQPLLIISLVFGIFLTNCSSQDPSPTTAQASWQEIAGREDPHTPVYHVSVPTTWTRHPLSPETNLLDTKIALCEFSIGEDQETLRITIHNFPSMTIEERISPLAQISRWKRQFEILTPTMTIITPQAYNGFSGLQFEGSGIQKGKPITVIGWSMQMAPEIYRFLLKSGEAETRQMRADYTIKVQGPKSLVEKHKQALTQFAHSFELIQPVSLSP